MLVYIPGPGPGMAILTAAADAPVELVHCDHAELGHVVAVRGGHVGHNGKHYLAPEKLEQIILQSIPEEGKFWRKFSSHLKLMPNL